MMRRVAVYAFAETRGEYMARPLGWVVVTIGCLALGLSGCGAKEREELQQKVTTLEQQLAKANGELVEKDAAMNELRTGADTAAKSLKEAQATIEAQAAKLARVQVERDKLKSEVAQLKKKKKR
jgi:septal ring factor EnvC (AmiA/AmiB activator)